MSLHRPCRRGAWARYGSEHSQGPDSASDAAPAQAGCHQAAINRHYSYRPLSPKASSTRWMHLYAWAWRAWRAEGTAGSGHGGQRARPGRLALRGRCRPLAEEPSVGGMVSAKEAGKVTLLRCVSAAAVAFCVIWSFMTIPVRYVISRSYQQQQSYSPKCIQSFQLEPIYLFYFRKGVYL